MKTGGADATLNYSFQGMIASTEYSMPLLQRGNWWLFAAGTTRLNYRDFGVQCMMLDLWAAAWGAKHRDASTRGGTYI